MRPNLTILVAVTLLGGSAAAWFLPGIRSVRADVSSVAATGVPRREAIAFYERRLREDPHSALDMAQLAALHMEQGRMTGDERAFAHAESLTRKSLGERRRRNGRSAALLVNALLAQHRFAEAASAARELVMFDPETPAYRALLAECLMEIGEYRNAIGQLGAIRAHRADLGIAPRFARWAELTGQTGEARRILRAARDEALKRQDLTAEQRAWFSLRLADLELRFGHLRGAAAAIEVGLRGSPDDWRLLLARARLEALQGRWSEARRVAEDVIAVVPSADAFALLATANQALGDKVQAATFVAALEGIAQGQSGTVHRSWLLTLLEHSHDAQRAVALAAADTLVRQDAYTFDLLAWSLHRAGRSVEALPLARRAVQLGTIEPALRYHAGMIELAAGDSVWARNHLELSLHGRRALSPSDVASAKKALASIRS